MPELLLHELHLAFVLSETTKDGFTLPRLFEALDSIDPLNRHRMLYHAPAYLGAETDYSIDDEEQLAENVYRDFKQKCIEVVAAGFFESAFVQAIVSLILGGLRNWGCPIKTRESEQFFSRARKHFDAELKKRPEDAATLEKLIRDSSEQIVNKEADRQLWADQYKTFCETVVVDLMNSKGSRE